MDNFQLPEDNFVQYKNLQQVHGCISKITLAFGNRSSLQKSKQLLRPHYQMSLHRNCDTLDIGKKAVHKGVGAKAIMEYLMRQLMLLVMVITMWNYLPVCGMA